MESYKYNKKNHKVFHITAFGDDYDVIVCKQRYENGNLALTVHNIDSSNGVTFADMFGVITTNLGDSLPENCAYIKTYSENEKWAKALAEKIGGVDLDMTASSGFCKFPMYDFSKIDIYANGETGRHAV